MRKPIAEGSVKQVTYKANPTVKDEPPPKGEGKREEAKDKIDLPKAIHLCTLQNFRLLAGETRIAQAQQNVLTASLIPNPSLFADAQLIPLQTANIRNQLGPPQDDLFITVPIDWLIFGKRVAAMQAEELGVAVARAEHDNLIRRTVSDTVDRFYELLQAEEFLGLAEKEHEDMKALETLIKQQGVTVKAGPVEARRIRLQVLESLLMVHARELEVATAKAKLRPLIGRTAADADFEVVGKLDVKMVVPAPELKEALALAEAHRPDLQADLHAIDRAQAVELWERKKAWPQVAIAPGYTYQDQRHIDGFRNGSLFNINFITSLPITDRNQGNIRKAMWQMREAQFAHLGDLADVRAEVEIVIAAYTDAVEDVTENDDPATLKDAVELREKIDAEFRAGNRKLVEVLDAHRAYQERKARHVEFEAVYWRTLNRLNTIVGLQAYDHAKAAKLPVKYEPRKEDEKEKK